MSLDIVELSVKGWRYAEEMTRNKVFCGLQGAASPTITRLFCLLMRGRGMQAATIETGGWISAQTSYQQGYVHPHPSYPCRSLEASAVLACLELRLLSRYSVFTKQSET